MSLTLSNTICYVDQQYTVYLLGISEVIYIYIYNVEYTSLTVTTLTVHVIAHAHTITLHVHYISLRNTHLLLRHRPQLAYIAVKTRGINIRFFDATSDVNSSPETIVNPSPGTIVDRVITKQQRYDFFLVSQSVRQGTATPTAYHVIHDDTELKADLVQRLTYKLCHLYYNWPGSIQVPAPCLYARKLACLTGQSLHAESKPELVNTLFYL